MHPIRRGELGNNIESAVVTFSDTGETYALKTQADSACHFFSRFTVGNDEIQLRLHWSDLDHNGHPMLDADFINPKTRKHRLLQGKRQCAHHTTSMSSGGRCYVWEFSGFSRQFSVTVTWLALVSENSYFGDFCSAEVIRAADHNPSHG